MTILDIFFLFMITTSLTLTGFVIRQRKNNRMLGELVAQNKVNSQSGYSKLDVGVKNKEYVSKCFTTVFRNVFGRFIIINQR